MPPKKVDAALGAIARGRRTKPSIGFLSTLTPRESIISDVLSRLRRCSTVQEALRFLKKRHPDTSQAIFNFINLAALGHKMEIYDMNGNRMPEAEAKWNELASRVYSVSNDGLDGLINQLHESALIDNGMAIEVEVNEDLDDIADIHPIDPQTLYWEQTQDGKLIPFQQVAGGKIPLDKANFFWVPNDPDYDDPTGTPAFCSLIAAADFQLQTDQDKQQVLHNQGWPRYDVVVDRESLVNSAPPESKSDAKSLIAYLRDILTQLQDDYASLNPDDAFIHFNDIEAKLIDGATSNSRGMDVRAIDEGVDRRVLAALKQLSAFMNRTAGVTETWSSVQFKIFCMAIKALQRKSKRLIESAAKLALRVWGIQGIPKLTFKELDDQSEKTRLEIKKLRLEVATWMYLLGYISHNEASLEAAGQDAVAEPIAIPRDFTLLGGEEDEVPEVQDGGDDNGSED